MSALKKIVGQTAIYGMSSILGRLLNYLLVPLYVRLFSPEEYGVVGELYAYIAISFVLLSHGMETAYFRFVKKHGNSAGATAFRSQLVAGLILVVMYAMFRSGLLQWMGYSEHGYLVDLLVGVLFLDTLICIPFAQLRYEGKALQFAGIKLTNIGVNIGLNLVFFLLLRPEQLGANSPQLQWILWANVAASASSALLLAPRWTKLLLAPRSAKWKEMFQYAWPLGLAGLAYVVNETLDRILIKQLLPESKALYELGIYNACYKLSILMTLFIQAIRLGIEPFFFQQKGASNEKANNALLLKWTWIGGWLIFLVVCLYLDIFKHFLDPEYFVGLGVVPILLAAQLFLGVYFHLSLWYKLGEKTHYGAIISVGGALVTVGLNLAFIPHYGYWASAWTTLAAYLFMVVFSFVWGRSNYHFGYPYLRLGGTMGMALGLFGLSWYFQTGLLMNTALLLTFVLYTLILERKSWRNLSK